MVKWVQLIEKKNSRIFSNTALRLDTFIRHIRGSMDIEEVALVEEPSWYDRLFQTNKYNMYLNYLQLSGVKIGKESSINFIYYFCQDIINGATEKKKGK